MDDISSCREYKQLLQLIQCCIVVSTVQYIMILLVYHVIFKLSITDMINVVTILILKAMTNVVHKISQILAIFHVMKCFASESAIATNTSSSFRMILGGTFKTNNNYSGTANVIFYDLFLILSSFLLFLCLVLTNQITMHT